MTMPLVSIIMGVYNAEKTLEACINSIINQTYTNWEFIICNDCSTDNSLSILNRYEKSDSRIKVFSNLRNERLAASLNECLSLCNGKYVARMDADDESLPDRFDKQVSFLEQHPNVDLVGCNRIIFDEKGNQGIRKSVEFPTKEILIKGSPFAHPTIMMKRSVYEELKGYTVSKKTIRAEDLDLWIRFYEHAYIGYNMQEVMYKYRENTNDLKKRNLVAAIETAKVYWNGYKILKVPYCKRIWCVKPIVAAIIPKPIMKKYYNNSLIQM